MLHGAITMRRAGNTEKWCIAISANTSIRSSLSATTDTSMEVLKAMDSAFWAKGEAAMSLFEDYDGHFEADYPFGVPNETWKTKSGAIKVKDMTESHIRNCMRIVGEDDAWYGYFAKELKRRNDDE